MPDSAPRMRGNFYPTFLTARCPSYHYCELCTGCTKYSPHDLVCAICESRKPVDLICVHTDQQQWTKKELDRRFKEPMFHPDKKPTKVDPGVSIAYEEKYERMLKQLGDRIQPLTDGVNRHGQNSSSG